MRPLLIVTAAWPLLCCCPAWAQVGPAMPALSTTSSLGTAPGAPVGPNGLLPPGASPEVSPVPESATGTITVPSTSSGMACSTVGISPSGLYGATATYDGGGLPGGSTGATSGTMASSGASTSPGISTSATISATSGVSTTSGMLDTSGLSGMCGSGSTSVASSSTPTSTSPTASSAGAQTGIPLASFQINNRGVSPVRAVPTTNLSPYVSTVGPTPSPPAIPTVAPPASTTAGTIP
jgi:hypothetical protein